MARLITRQEAAQLFDVTPQTISNWCRKGIINARMVGGQLVIDKESLMAYFDTLEEVGRLEKAAGLEKERLSKKLAELNARTEQYKKALWIVRGDLPEQILKDIFMTILDSAGEEILTDREEDVLKQLVRDINMDAVADSHRISRTRLMQIVGRALRNMRRMKTYSEIRRELYDCRQENKEYMDIIKNQNKQINELQEELDIRQRRSQDMENAVRKTGLTFHQLVKLFDKPLADYGLSIRALNSLKALDVNNIGDLLQIQTPAELLRLRNFGKKTFVEVMELVRSLPLDWGTDVKEIRRTYVLEKINGTQSDVEK